MKNVIVVPNVSKDKGFSVTDRIVEKLVSIGMNVFIDSTIEYTNSAVNVYDNVPDNIDLIVVIGGDGSVIDASQMAIDMDVPLLGINLGRLGYLAEVEVDDISTLEKIVDGSYSITEKMLLSVAFKNNVAIDRYAVNDVSVSRDSLFNIADIRVEDSSENSVKIRADGVILSTPQGSTAYSFSAGGPIVAHDVESVLLTPVSSHSFFNRSVLFNSSEIIKITNMGQFDLNVNVDGRSVGSIASGEYCLVKKADKHVKMLTFKKNSMFTSLFKKMRILGDID